MKGFIFVLGTTLCSADIFEPLPWEDYLLIPMAAITLAIVGGIMSGLTVGLMGIDSLSLKVKLEFGTELEKYHSSRILPIIEDHHLLLVTLLLCNAIALETLPLVLDQMVGGFTAVIVSVILTLFVAEVIPQALCIGPQQIPIASSFATLVRIAIYLFYPISYPIARLLDKTIGHQTEKKLNYEELKALFTLQLDALKTQECLQERQVVIIHKVIDSKLKSIGDICIPIESVYYMESDGEVNEQILHAIRKKKFSRIPVRDEDKKWVGVLIVKKLVLAQPGMRIADFDLRQPTFIDQNSDFYDAIPVFSEGNCHLAFVKDENDEVVGIVTLEDILQQFMKKRDSMGQLSFAGESENDTSDKRTESIFRKIYNKFRGEKSLEMPLVSEFQMAEKNP